MMRDIEHRYEIVKNFAPSWFASVMGTGILAITSLFYSKYLPFLKYVAQGLFYFNVVLFFALLIPWLLRWVFFRRKALDDLEHPVVSNFYATMAIAMLVLSANFMVIGGNMVAGEIFWFCGVILTVAFAIITPYIMFKGEHVKIDHINPAWFIPPVGLIVIPVPGGLLLDRFHGIAGELVTFLNYFGWGAGFFIYLALFAVCMYRFILHPPLPNTLAPTVWINLGPIGAGTVALINMIKHSGWIIEKEPFFVFGLIFWAFGIWWVLIAIALTLHYIRRISLPYRLSWWAFTFPLGAYVAASFQVSKIFNLELVSWIGFVLYGLLAFFWSITLVNTAVKAYHGTLFKSN